MLIATNIQPSLKKEKQPQQAPGLRILAVIGCMRGGVTLSSPAESLSGTPLRFRRLFLPIFRSSGRFERVEKPTRDPGDIVDSRIERGLVRLGWCVEAADLPHEL